MVRAKSPAGISLVVVVVSVMGLTLQGSRFSSGGGAEVVLAATGEREVGEARQPEAIREPDRPITREREGRRREAAERPGPPALEGEARPREELREAAEAIRRELREIGEGQPHRREALVRKLEEIERRMAAVEWPERPRPPMPLERVRQRIGELEEQIARAERAGDERLLGKLRGEVGRLREMLARMEAGRDVPAAEGPRELPREERERRLHHLRIAIENLRAAGLEDVARRLEEGVPRFREGQPPAIVPPGPPEGPPVPAEMRRIGEAVKELLARTERLARRIDELAARLGRLEAHIPEQR